MSFAEQYPVAWTEPKSATSACVLHLLTLSEPKEWHSSAPLPLELYQEQAAGLMSPLPTVSRISLSWSVQSTHELQSARLQQGCRLQIYQAPSKSSSCDGYTKYVRSLRSKAAALGRGVLEGDIPPSPRGSSGLMSLNHGGMVAYCSSGALRGWFSTYCDSAYSSFGSSIPLMGLLLQDGAFSHASRAVRAARADGHTSCSLHVESGSARDPSSCLPPPYGKAC